MKVLIVDDSAFMRKMINDFLHGYKGIEVAGTARNGRDAIEKIEKLNPDVITMDVEMPVMNGIDAVKEIMTFSPRPVIMLSSTTQAGAEATFLALEAGAVDFVAKPSGAISLDLHKIRDELREKVLSAKHAKINMPLVPEKNQKPHLLKTKYSKISSVKENIPIEYNRIRQETAPLICMGTSTGGPRALQRVLPSLPADLGGPVFIVQHMPKGFTASLAERLNRISMIQVKEACSGEKAEAGTAYIAPGGSHLTVLQKGKDLFIKVDQEPARNGHRPSVDVLFESISILEGFSNIAVIMTGMGSDGTKGLCLLKEKGNTNAIAESEHTSIVYGMPRSAIAADLIDAVEDADNIAERILHYIQS
nr:chemotaxis response regulator protein-glutamate methylesterase [Metabacillus mangrovi]